VPFAVPMAYYGKTTPAIPTIDMAHWPVLNTEPTEYRV
jgi:hypothetical protein